MKVGGRVGIGWAEAKREELAEAAEAEAEARDRAAAAVRNANGTAVTQSHRVNFSTSPQLAAASYHKRLGNGLRSISDESERGLWLFWCL
jgi:hypothetical protein